MPSLVGVALICGAPGCGADSPRTAKTPDEDPDGMEASYSFDAGDKRQLVAFADNVFVGRVTKRVGNTTLPTSAPGTDVPETQFAVQVVDNIKNHLRGTVTVSQFGGPVDVVVERNVRRVNEREVDLLGGDPLLKRGEVVLLATRYNRVHDWHTIVAQPFADRRIRSAAERDRLVREFSQARRAPLPR